jgi:hypothetical protein
MSIAYHQFLSHLGRAAEAVLTTTGVQRALLAWRAGVFAAFGFGVAV